MFPDKNIADREGKKLLVMENVLLERIFPKFDVKVCL